MAIIKLSKNQLWDIITFLTPLEITCLQQINKNFYMSLIPSLLENVNLFRSPEMHSNHMFYYKNGILHSLNLPDLISDQIDSNEWEWEISIKVNRNVDYRFNKIIDSGICVSIPGERIFLLVPETDENYII